jgi:Kef-type K+ transport system membrane component KefB
MELLEFLRTHALALPDLAKFGLGMALIVGVPPLCRRVRLPAVVGLLLSGVIIGPHVMDFFGEKRPVADFFADLGKLLLMFFAGLEIDLAHFRAAKNRSITFGLLTTGVPLLLGTAVGLWFDYPLVPAIVIGSLLASHTLLASPIVTRLGVNRLEPVTITVGATVMSDTLSMIVFAICVSTFRTGFSAFTLAVQLLEIAIFVPLILFGVSRAGAYVLNLVVDDEDAYFILMLGILAIAGLLAQIINLPGIVGVAHLAPGRGDAGRHAGRLRYAQHRRPTPARPRDAECGARADGYYIDSWAGSDRALRTSHARGPGYRARSHAGDGEILLGEWRAGLLAPGSV